VASRLTLSADASNAVRRNMDAPGGDCTAVCNLIRFAYYSAAV
jgi:hypothetical protein